MRARKVDANGKAMSTALKKLGWLVHPTNGDWDATICRNGVIRLIEFKDPVSTHLKRRNKGNDLIEQGWPIIRVLTIDDCLAVK